MGERRLTPGVLIRPEPPGEGLAQRTQRLVGRVLHVSTGYWTNIFCNSEKALDNIGPDIFKAF